MCACLAFHSAACYLGNLLYDRRRYTEAIALWEAATELLPDYAVPWRNLGIARFNAQNVRCLGGVTAQLVYVHKKTDSTQTYKRHTSAVLCMCTQP